MKEIQVKIKWFYKGIRVRSYYREIFWKVVVGIVLIPAIISMLLIGWNVGFRYRMNDLIRIVFISFGIGGVLALLLFRLGIWHHIYNIQKLCQMAWDSVLYNLEGEKVNGKIVSYRKDMTYFPRIYYRYRRGQVIVSIKLDGSKFHERFTRFSERLTEMLDMEVVSEKRKYWYMVYILEDIAEERLWLGKDEIICDRNEIPLMKNLSWNYKRAPHVLITGNTGGGKTYLLEYFIISMKKMGAVVKIVDPKRSDLYNLRHLLGESNVAYAAGRVMQIFREAVKEMEERYAKLDGMPLGSDYEVLGLPPVFLIFDEFVAFIQKLEKEDGKKIMSYLTSIVLEGRQAGIYLVFATQRADAEYLPGAIRDNLGLRVALGGLEKAGFRMTFGDVDRNLEKFEPGHGYVYVSGVTDSVREFYAPLVSEEYDPVERLEEIMKQTVPPCELRSSSSGSDKGGTVLFGVGEAGTKQGQKSATPHY